MSREEEKRIDQIQRAARDLFGLDVSPITINMRIGFVHGAGWADDNPMSPSEELIKTNRFYKAKLAGLEAKLALAVEALEAIAKHSTCEGYSQSETYSVVINTERIAAEALKRIKGE